MATGTVKPQQQARSFWFIDVDGEEKDAFVHESSLEEGVRIDGGMRVSFDLQETEKGLNAANVKPLSEDGEEEEGEEMVEEAME